ncbi:hypothetical protein ACQB60_44135 [Actinomycetota bacterium Odt1-20B]
MDATCWHYSKAKATARSPAMSRDQWLRTRAARIGRRHMARRHTGAEETPSSHGPPLLILAHLSPRRQLWLNIVLCVLSGFALATTLICFGHSHRARTLEDTADGASWVVITGLLFLFLTVNLLLIRPFNGSVRRCWISAIAFSVICAIGIGTIWELARSEPPEGTVIGLRVTNRRDVARFISARYEKADHPFQVPTGVQLQGVRFPGGHNVEVTGYLWMYFPKEIPASIPRSFTLPEAQGAPQISQVYHHADAHGEAFGWTFSTTLRQNFDYTKYPLDRHSIWIRIWPAGKMRSVIAVPDFGSYPPWQDELLLGTDPQFTQAAGLKPVGTAFSYETNTYRTSLGRTSYSGSSATPELYFNLVVQREIYGALGKTVVPLTAVAILIFVTLLLTTRDHERRERVGFTSLATLSLGMTALLVTVVRHKDILDFIDSDVNVYLETFPILIYAMIVGTIVNAVLVATTANRALLWRENLLPALLFWPILTGVLFLVTIVTFQF